MYSRRCRQVRPRRKRGMLEPQHLQRAARPAAALDDERADLLGGQAEGHDLVVVGDLPAARVQLEAGVGVLDDGLGGDAADLEEGLAAQQRRAAAPEGRAVAVLPAADHVEEDALLVAQGVVDRARVPEAPVVEGLGALDDGDARVGHVADHPLDQLGAGDVVGVEGDDELGVEVPEDVVDVAGLRVVRGAPGGTRSARPPPRTSPPPRRGRRRRAPRPRGRRRCGWPARPRRSGAARPRPRRRWRSGWRRCAPPAGRAPGAPRGASTRR